MLADKTNTYMQQQQAIPTKKRVQLDIQYVAQTFEKTQSIINLQDMFQNGENNTLTEQSTMQSEESEIEKLSQAYADKYYYEMKFEQYQNLLTQQQGTITKLLNEKKDLIFRLETAQSNQKDQSLLQQLEIKFLESQKQNQHFQQESIQYKEKCEKLLELNSELQNQIQNLGDQKFQQEQYILKQQELIEKLTQDLNNRVDKYQNQKEQDISNQILLIKEQNNLLSEQLKKQEDIFDKTGKDIKERFQIQIVNQQQEYELQLEQKEEELHNLRLELDSLRQEMSQIQNQLNDQEDVQTQAYMLSEQVQQYKMIVENLENQLHNMNQEMKQRERSNSKDLINSRLISNYIKMQGSFNK